MMTAKSLISSFPLESLLAGIVDKALVRGINVTGIATDSRKVKSGDLFIACIVGDVSNISYINDAIKAGASVVLVDERQLPDPSLCPVPLFRTKELVKKIGVIADRFYQHPSADMKVVGVTGTNGKTSVSHLLAQCLNDLSEKDCGLIGTLGYGSLGNLVPGPNTTPEPLTLQALLADMRDQKFRKVVMEVSSHGLDQYRVVGVKFDLAIFTNLSRDHLDYHKTQRDYAISKQRLFHEYEIKKHVINIDDEIGKIIFNELPENVQKIACTLEADKYNSSLKKEDLILGKVIDIQPDGMTIEIHSPWGEGILSTQFMGEFNVRNILSVLSALCLLGYSFDEAISRISHCKNIPGRLESFGNDSTPKVIVDYAHTPDALEQVLATLKSACAGKLYCVFGCGGDRDPGKRALMAAVAEKFANFITITSDNPRNEDPEKIIKDIYAGISNSKNVEIEIDRATAIGKTIRKASINDIVVIAGKGHEDYQEIAGVRRPFSDQQIARKILGLTE